MKYRLVWVLLIVIVMSNILWADTVDSLVVFQQRPQTLQLYTRDSGDSAVVALRGEVIRSGFDSVAVRVYRDGEIWQQREEELLYTGDRAVFALEVSLFAGLFEYTVHMDLLADSGSTRVLTADSLACGDAYILTGQSNSHYAWSTADFQSEFCRTFGVKTGQSNYNTYAPGDTLWHLSQGSSSLGPGVGALGIAIQKILLQEQEMPTCLINGGTGGSTISEHLPNESQRTDLATIYGKVLYRVQKAGIDRIRAILWHQGESDANNARVGAYRDRFYRLYQAWERDFDPERVYCFQLRPNGSGNAQGKFREVQRTLPDSLGLENVDLMSTNALPGHDGLHYSNDGYREMARWVCRLIQADFYASTDTVDIHPPDIDEILYQPEHQRLVLRFHNTTTLLWPDPLNGYELEDYFYLDGVSGLVQSGTAEGDSVVLELTGPQFVDYLTYLPDRYYNDSYEIYDGPWLVNSRGVGALSFYQLPVNNPESRIKVVSPNGGEVYKPETEQTIEWTQTGLDSIIVEFTTDAGKTWTPVAGPVAADAGTLTWTLPDVISETCRIRLSARGDPAIADESNGNFGIFTPVLTVLEPNGGEEWTVGSTQTIRWTGQFVEGNIQIKVSFDGGESWTLVKRLVSVAEGQTEWTVPETLSNECLIRIQSLGDSEVVDLSDSPFAIVSTTSVIDDVERAPAVFSLYQNHPNPFNPSTCIEYQLSHPCRVRLTLVDIRGRILGRLVDHEMPAGRYQVELHAGSYNLSSGIYFYHLEAGVYRQVRKMLLIE
jgi:hypothetical protein